MYEDLFIGVLINAFAHREARCTMALAGGAITHPSIHTQAGLQAAVTVEAVRAGLVTEQPRPPGLARAFPFHRVAAGQPKYKKIR